MYASKKNNYKIHSSVKKIKHEEKNLRKKLFDFKDKVINSKFKFYELLNKLKKQKNIKIAGISAPSRSTTLINYVGIDENIIEYIFEVKGSKNSIYTWNKN